MSSLEFGRNMIQMRRKYTFETFNPIKAILLSFKFFFENVFINAFSPTIYYSGKIHYTEMYDMLKNMDPPLGFGNKCPNRLAYKKLIRMNMPMDADGKVNFTTTLFALIRENLSIKMRTGKFTYLLLCIKLFIWKTFNSGRNGPS